MKASIIISFIILLTLPSMATDLFMIGANAEKLREAYGDELPELRSTSKMGFNTCIGGVNGIVVYSMRDNVAAWASFLVPTENRLFIKSLKDFSILLNLILKDGKETTIDIRFGGAKERESANPLIHPPNYISISGSWKKGYHFTATLNGDDVVDIQKAGVDGFSIGIYPEMSPPKEGVTSRIDIRVFAELSS